MKETALTLLEEITLSMKLSIWSKSSCGKFLPLGKKSREEKKKWDESEAKILRTAAIGIEAHNKRTKLRSFCSSSFFPL